MFNQVFSTTMDFLNSSPILSTSMESNDLLAASTGTIRNFTFEVKKSVASLGVPSSRILCYHATFLNSFYLDNLLFLKDPQTLNKINLKGPKLFSSKFF